MVANGSLLVTSCCLSPSPPSASSVPPLPAAAVPCGVRPGGDAAADGSGATAAAIVYVAHWGNLSANWVPICFQFHGFCQRTSGAIVASFLVVVVFLVLVLMAMRRR
jgi:hypothetical protein